VKGEGAEVVTDETASTAPPIPHQRRARYSGKHPRRFAEKYKEHQPGLYAETVAKVLASGKTPAGMHRPIMVAEVLQALAPQPGEVAVDCTLGYGGHAQELLARIHGLIRRSTGAVEATRISAGALSIDLLRREATLSEKVIDLQPREFSLLEFLMRNAGRIVSKTMILEHIWDYSFDPQTNVVDVLICRLRSKLDKEGVQKIIRTVRGAGYVLKA